MSIQNWPGGVISKTAPVPTQAAASGVWTLDQQAYWQKIGQWPAPPYQIQRSLRFNSADSAYLNRTPASAGNRTTWTWSGWVKLGQISTTRALFSCVVSSTETTIYFGADNKLFLLDYQAGAFTGRLQTTQVFRDPSAWYHIVAVWNTTSATAGDRMRLYVNGSEITAFDIDTQPPQNTVSVLNTTNETRVGSYLGSSISFDGYMTEVNFIDGLALTPSSFGFTDAQTGVWGPSRYVGVYGTNGFYLNFSDNSNTTATTLGKDYSPNGNNWTPNNFSVSAGAGNDSLVDVPTNWGVDTGVGGTVRGNYATWNPLVVNRPTLTNGNLDADGSDLKTAISTIGVSTGKWYWEILIRTGTDTPNMGVTSFANDNADPGVYLGVGRSYVSSGGGSGIYKNYTSTSTVADSDFSNANTAGAIIGFALDCDAGTLAYYVNNVLGHTDTTIATGTLLYPMTCNFNSAANAYRNTSVNFGQRPFAYTAPSGFKALNTQNLPTPTIGATPATQAGKFFNPVLYTGTGSSLSVTGVGFQPDWVWIKERNAAADHGIYDVVRGVQKQLESNTTGAETTETTGLTAFGSDGFTVGALAQLNTSADTYVAWNWKANGAGVTNTAGSITSTVSANTTSGFSVVTWTGNSTNGATIGHGLGAAPSFVIVKSRNDTFDWIVWSRSFATNNTTAFLNTTDAAGAYGVWSSTLPSSTVITLPSSSYVNGSTKTYVAYCFAEVPGYSRFGSYTGNGSTDGPFVFCGFRPAYLLVKRSDQAYDWWVFDGKRPGYNVTSNRLAPNLSDAEYTSGTIVDFTANGFKIRDASQGWNGSGGTIVFAAFAESPQKFSLAR
jgi:hypothetical protein